MTELTLFLKNLISAPGLSGHESPVRRIIEEAWMPLTDELNVSRLGSLHGLRRGRGSEPRPSILLAAHMDAIGFMATSVIDGFIRFTRIGGIDPRVLPGQLVTVHGRENLPGLIVQPSPRLLPPKHQTGPTPMEYLLIDVGLQPEDVARLVRPGDLISYAQPPLDMAEETLAGHSLDNRASVAAVTQCLIELQSRAHTWDVWAVATAQEEETLGGAATSTYQLRPSLAIAIDVTFGSSPGSPGHKTFSLGEGITLGLGPNIHPKLHQSLKELADRLEIPNQLEPMPRHSGTDAIAMQVVNEGVPCMVVSIPLRYMHTAVEMVSIKDIRRCGRLLAEFIAQLTPDFMEKIVWEDQLPR
jgi:tetrahedral aminopeptidase